MMPRFAAFMAALVRSRTPTLKYLLQITLFVQNSAKHCHWEGWCEVRLSAGPSIFGDS
jgi:hypothetical protein